MFRAIGKWGSSVKANINLKFITNLFGSKSKPYNEIESDEEEIFSDAREDLIDQEDEVEDDKILMRDTVETSASNTTKIVNGSAPSAESDAVVVEHISHSDEDSSDVDSVDEENADDGENNDTTDASEHMDNADDERHDHKDSEQILEAANKPSNGLIKSASASAFKKVHRRMNSYSQRQYNKMDEHTDDSEIEVEKDPNDNIDGMNGAVNDKVRNGKQKSKSKDKKTKKRNKVPLFKFFRGLIRFPFRGNSAESGTK